VVEVASTTSLGVPDLELDSATMVAVGVVGVVAGAGAASTEVEGGEAMDRSVHTDNIFNNVSSRKTFRSIYKRRRIRNEVRHRRHQAGGSKPEQSVVHQVDI
jgi:hypothetical protein